MKKDKQDRKTRLESFIYLDVLSSFLSNNCFSCCNASYLDNQDGLVPQELDESRERLHDQVDGRGALENFPQKKSCGLSVLRIASETNERVDDSSVGDVFAEVGVRSGDDFEDASRKADKDRVALDIEERDEPGKN